MRKSALSTKSNKVYNPNSLEIIGDKITLWPVAPSKKIIKIDSVEQEEPYTIQKPCLIHTKPKAIKATYKHFLKTSVTEYTNAEVSNKVLKQIRETSKVEDFERILQSLCQSTSYIRPNKRDTLLEGLDADDLYGEYFGKHFDYLSSVANKARAEEVQN